MDDPRYSLILLGSALLGHLPLIVIAIVGIILAGRRVADSPRAARLARTACVILLIAELLPLAQPFIIMNGPSSGVDLMGGLIALGLISFVLLPVAVGLLLAAAVTRRRTPAATTVAGFGVPTQVGPVVSPSVPDFGASDVISSR